MATATTSETLPTIDDPEIMRQVNELRQIDNSTNWYYLAREWVFIALVIAISVTLFQTFWDGWWSLVWAIPLTFATHLCIGASQHRLATLTHEAAHYMLFKNRLLNELVSELCCMFPILGTTHSYRVQHIGHHQYPNDPELDPDWTQLRLSGHRFDFPMTFWEFLWHCFFKQFLWAPNLLRYVLVRAVFRVDMPSGPYHMKRVPTHHLTVIGFFYHVGLIALLAYGVWSEALEALLWGPLALFAGMIALIALGPEDWFPEYTVRADIPERLRSGLRFGFNSVVLFAIAWLTYWTGAPVWLYYFLCWLWPLGTAFSFFMILRQIVQHGNADTHRFTNTRIFLVNALIRMAVFPIGNDYHLPHHLFQMVPHYNLEKLHEILMGTRPYRDEAVVVTGYFFHDSEEPPHPTVVELMTNEMKVGSA
ncbi:MAG: fatty acid desaturase [Planctomycetes bacterium]|nr:fatty acid desaturase [Planctomycetota bacterium]